MKFRIQILILLQAIVFQSLTALAFGGKHVRFLDESHGATIAERRIITQTAAPAVYGISFYYAQRGHSERDRCTLKWAYNAEALFQITPDATHWSDRGPQLYDTTIQAVLRVFKKIGPITLTHVNGFGGGAYVHSDEIEVPCGHGEALKKALIEDYEGSGRNYRALSNLDSLDTTECSKETENYRFFREMRSLITADHPKDIPPHLHRYFGVGSKGSSHQHFHQILSLADGFRKICESTPAEFRSYDGSTATQIALALAPYFNRNPILLIASEDSLRGSTQVRELGPVKIIQIELNHVSFDPDSALPYRGSKADTILLKNGLCDCGGSGIACSGIAIKTGTEAEAQEKAISLGRFLQKTAQLLNPTNPHAIALLDGKNEIIHANIEIAARDFNLVNPHFAAELVRDELGVAQGIIMRRRPN